MNRRGGVSGQRQNESSGAYLKRIGMESRDQALAEPRMEPVASSDGEDDWDEDKSSSSDEESSEEKSYHGPVPVEELCEEDIGVCGLLSLFEGILNPEWIMRHYL